MSNQNELNFLFNKLSQIQQKQDILQSDILQLQQAIDRLRQQTTVEEITAEPIILPVEEIAPAETPTVEIPREIPKPQPEPVPYYPPSIENKKSDVERFIGENLISKIGILILIIGVGIGVKLAIDNNLMGPMVRIIFGYVCAAALLGIGVLLKKKYSDFSAVLFSGGVATAYFTTYFASAFYEFLPKEIAFPIMVLLTVGTIFAAIWYNREVIAHIGLWGAYAVPVLLSDGSNKVEYLYTYMLVINAGIMILTYKREWKFIFVNAFVSSWAIFFFSSFIDFHTGKSAITELLFATGFFLLFYLSMFADLLHHNRKDGGITIAIVVINGIIFAAFGSTLIYNINQNDNYSALFIVLNGLLYLLGAAIAFYKNREADVFKVLSVLAVLFFVVAAPIQFSGMLIPLLWTVIILVLILLKRTLKSDYLAWLSVPIYIVVLVGCMYGFGKEIYDVNSSWKPFMRIDFLWAVLVICFIGITYKLVQEKTAEGEIKSNLASTLGNLSSLLFVLLIYLLFLTEIISYFRADYLASFKNLPLDDAMNPGDFYQVKNKVIINIGVMYSLIYTICFSAILGLVNALYIKNKLFATLHQILNGALTLIFLLLGLILLQFLDRNYLYPEHADLYPAQQSWINLRYIAFASFAFLIITEWMYSKKGFLDKGFKIFLEILLHFILIAVISHEIMHWSSINHIPKLDKYGLSIFWGTYALFLVGFGIWKNRKFLRIEGMVLIGVTLIKLFAYDTTNLGGLPRIALFISLGLLLLIISFLYNKYKDYIIDDKDE